VFEDENRFGAAGRLFLAAFFIWGRRRSGHERKINLDRGAFIFFAFDAQMSAVLVDNAVTSRESKSAALFLCAEERFEQMRFHLFAHTASVVGHINANVLPGNKIITVKTRRGLGGKIDNRRLEGELAALWHRVARIDREVENDLRDLIRIRLDVRAFLLVM